MNYLGVDAREAERLAAVARYGILDTPEEEAFDRIARLAAHVLDVPMATVSIVDEHRVWFKAHHGIEEREVAREPGFCSSAVEQLDPWVIEHASVDPRTLDHSLVAGAFGLEFYAGIPLRSTEGHNLGTLCVMDHEPRRVTAKELEVLADLAAIVVRELELRRSSRRLADDTRARVRALRELAATDPLTGLANRRTFDAGLGGVLDAARRTGGLVSIVMVDLDHFKAFNDAFGHAAGDRALEGTARALEGDARHDDIVARLGGEEFALVLSGADERDAISRAERVRARLADVRVPGAVRRVTASFGIATFDGVESDEELVRRADASLYRAKGAGRDRIDAPEPD
ncbi:GGDEF domain-containing protein [Patulibacter sp. S7RM1-6]